MDKSTSFLFDSGVAAGLAVALMAVIGLDKLLPSASKPSDSGGVVIQEQPVVKISESAPAKPLRLAVTPTYEEFIKSQSGAKELEKWDDMPKLLDSLGQGYKYTIFPTEDLFDAKKLAQFDVLFFTCGRGDADTTITENLRQFVLNGGTLYASDWRYNAVALAFPEYRRQDLEGSGRAGRIVADVVDAGLRDILGPTVELVFNLSQWKPAAFGSDRLPESEKSKFKTLISGTYERQRGGRATTPLLVKFQAGKGVIIFTSFHNEKQNSAVEQKLLKYLVFSAVTAKTEAQVTQTMIKGGFSPQKSNLLSASADNPRVTKTYHNDKVSHLRFVLGFENRGARLRLTVISPDGTKKEEVGTSTITMDFASAPPGDWQYTVTAEEIPFPDFPFTVTVGESAAKK